jgi:uncharacterized protein (DUF2062 family)
MCSRRHCAIARFFAETIILASIAANGLTGLHSPVTMSSLFLVVGETAGKMLLQHASAAIG